MKPQKNEPCNNCKLWSDENGCEHYNSSAMIYFCYCGKRVPKEEEKLYSVKVTHTNEIAE